MHNPFDQEVAHEIKRRGGTVTLNRFAVHRQWKIGNSFYKVTDFGEGFATGHTVRIMRRALPSGTTEACPDTYE